MISPRHSFMIWGVTNSGCIPEPQKGLTVGIYIHNFAGDIFVGGVFHRCVFV